MSADKEPLARPPTVAYATSPEDSGLSAEPGVRPPLQATAETPWVEAVLTMGSAWVDCGVSVTCPGVTVGLPLSVTNLPVEQLFFCIAPAFTPH